MARVATTAGGGKQDVGKADLPSRSNKEARLW